MSSIINELSWRGLIAQSTDLDALRAATDGRAITLYCGFDPTAPSLHLGNLVQILTVRRFQQHGHRPLALVGGATGLIGDPKESGERSLNPTEVVEAWVARIRQQLDRFYDFDGPNAAVAVNNLDWTAGMGVLEFLRDVGKHFSVNRMLDREAVAARLAKDGISYTEFSYQLLQSYDYVELYRRYGCTLQTGGSDQWGNITAGVDLIRRMEGAHAHALTTPLMVKADGTKFGKTEGGNVWLDPKRTSPYQFYQFWLNAADADAGNYIRIFTLKGREEIEALEAEHAQAPHQRALQKALAADITARVHGDVALNQALVASDILFGGATADALRSLDEATLLDVFSGVPQMTISRDALAGGLGILDVIAPDTTLFPSRGEAKKLLAAGGVSLNKHRAEPDQTVTAADLIAGRYLVVQKGKRNYALVVATSN